MNKIPTLFIRNKENMKLVLPEINPDALWLFDVDSEATIKKDGTNVRVTVKDGRCVLFEKRKNPSREEKLLGAEPGYTDAQRTELGDQYIFLSLDNTDFSGWPDGKWSCEALGPKIQGGIESNVPSLYCFELFPIKIEEKIDLNFESIKDFLSKNEVEGIVWHSKESSEVRMAKIKRRDFGFEWPIKSH